MHETCRSVKKVSRPYVKKLRKFSCAPFGLVQPSLSQPPTTTHPPVCPGIIISAASRQQTSYIHAYACYPSQTQVGQRGRDRRRDEVGQRGRERRRDEGQGRPASQVFFIFKFFFYLFKLINIFSLPSRYITENLSFIITFINPTTLYLILEFASCIFIKKFL